MFGGEKERKKRRREKKEEENDRRLFPGWVDSSPHRFSIRPEWARKGVSKQLHVFALKRDGFFSVEQVLPAWDPRKCLRSCKLSPRIRVSPSRQSSLDGKVNLSIVERVCHCCVNRFWSTSSSSSSPLIRDRDRDRSSRFPFHYCDSEKIHFRKIKVRIMDFNQRF